MKKEQVLDLWKNHIVQMKNLSKKGMQIKEITEGLSTEDKEWLEKNYQEWFQTNFSEDINKYKNVLSENPQNET